MASISGNEDLRHTLLWQEDIGKLLQGDRGCVGQRGQDCIPETEQGQATDSQCPAPHFCREHHPFSAGTSFKKTTALCSKRSKNTSAKYKELLGFTKRKERRKKALTSGLWLPAKPLLGTLPISRQKGRVPLALILTSQPPHIPTPQPTGLKY